MALPEDSNNVLWSASASVLNLPRACTPERSLSRRSPCRSEASARDPIWSTRGRREVQPLSRVLSPDSQASVPWSLGSDTQSLADARVPEPSLPQPRWPCLRQAGAHPARCPGRASTGRQSEALGAQASPRRPRAPRRELRLCGSGGPTGCPSHRLPGERSRGVRGPPQRRVVRVPGNSRKHRAGVSQGLRGRAARTVNSREGTPQVTPTVSGMRSSNCDVPSSCHRSVCGRHTGNAWCWAPGSISHGHTRLQRLFL